MTEGVGSKGTLSEPRGTGPGAVIRATLADVEGRFHYAFEHAAIGMALVSLDGRYLRVNRSLCDLVGRSEAELTGASWQSITHPDDVAPGVEGMVSLTGGARSFRLEKRYLRPDGRVVWVLLHVSLVTDDTGTPVCLFTQVHDVTDRRRVEEALRESERRMRSIIETTGDAFVEADEAGRITDWNPAAESLFGWPASEALGRVVEELVVPARFRDEFRTGREEVQRGERDVPPDRLELWALHRDGHEFPVELTAWSAATLSETRLRAFVRDISERKRAEQALQDRSERLQRRAAELEELDRTRVRLFGILTHELLHPVAALRALILVLQVRWDELDGEQRRDLLGRLDREAARLASQAEEAAGVRDLELEAFTLDPKPGRPGGLAREAAELAGGLTGRLAVRVAPEAEEAIVAADRARLFQVLRNLLSNAAKYGDPAGEVVLELTAGDDEVVFAVRDRGPGIPQPDQEHLFQPFSRLEGGEGAPGTGLGLYISKRIVEAHGGRIWVESAPGEGSGFCFALPRVHPGA